MSEQNNLEQDPQKEVVNEPDAGKVDPVPGRPAEDARKESVSDTGRQQLKEKTLEEVQSYLDRMAYDPPETSYKSPPHTSTLARPHPLAVAHAYNRFKNVMTPKRAARLKRQVDELQPISTEEYEKMAQTNEKAMARRRRLRQIREKILIETLEKQRAQLRQKAMNEIIDKFIEAIAEKAAGVDLDHQSAKCAIAKHSKVINPLLYMMHEKINGGRVPFSGVVPMSHMKIAIVLTGLIDFVKTATEQDIPGEAGLEDPTNARATRDTMSGDLARRARLAAQKKVRRKAAQTAEASKANSYSQKLKELFDILETNRNLD